MPFTFQIIFNTPDYEPYEHLFKLYRTLAQGIESGTLLDAAIDWLKSEIHQLEHMLGLQK